MSVYKYPKFKIVVDPESKKKQGLQTGDIVRRQYRDGNNLIYSLMVVMETGSEMIDNKNSHYFVGALIDGDEPENGQLLNFVRITNLFNGDRSGSLYLTAFDSHSPYMDVLDSDWLENSLIYPNHINDLYIPNEIHYFKKEFFLYKDDVSRVFRLTKNAIISINDYLGIRQKINRKLSHPQRVLISFKCKANRLIRDVKISIGYSNGDNMDAQDLFTMTADWQYFFYVFTIDYPSRYERSLYIDLTGKLVENRWVEIGDLNVILLEDVVNFSNLSKGRVGKITGIVDPVFGTLDGYGAYFQNFYATKNVNISGTLTAGDIKGMASTFYVGKIHKNVIQYSISFLEDKYKVNEKSPVGIGNVYKVNEDIKLNIQSEEWRKKHIGERYCFSIWVKSEDELNISLLIDEFQKEIQINNEWKRENISFVISDKNEGIIIQLSSTSDYLISCPQLEEGISPTANQLTDGVLNEVDDYGAWFSKGGVGGTIQNPLLKFNEDGSISSKDNSFVINPDGTGYMAGGRFTWSKNEITLKDITLKWEDFNDETKENLQPILLNIVSDGLVIKNDTNDVKLKAVLMKNGKELDVEGKIYTYDWKIWNEAGTTVLKNLSGKNITVFKSLIEDKNKVECEVRE